MIRSAEKNDKIMYRGVGKFCIYKIGLAKMQMGSRSEQRRRQKAAAEPAVAPKAAAAPEASTTPQ